jgi:hypothetical protein
MELNPELDSFAAGGEVGNHPMDDTCKASTEMTEGESEKTSKRRSTAERNDIYMLRIFIFANGTVPGLLKRSLISHLANVPSPPPSLSRPLEAAAAAQTTHDAALCDQPGWLAGWLADAGLRGQFTVHSMCG